jgi:aspartate--ammonia ligase
MGIRVTAETLKQQLTISTQLDWMKLPYHQAILNNNTPFSNRASGVTTPGL